MKLLKKSIEIIEKMQLKNGAILATFKNDAYPYVYPRDASIMTLALNLHGLQNKSKKFYRFMKNVRYNHYIDQRYNTDGLPYITQRGEKDVGGLVLRGIWDTYEKSLDRDFLEDMWPFVRTCADFYEPGGLVYTRRSIHEFLPIEEGYEVWANSAVCRGLYDAEKIAKELGKESEAVRWGKRAIKLEMNIKRKLFHPRLKIYVKTIKRGGKMIYEPDASMVAPYYFGIDNSHRTLKRTLGYLRRRLWHKKLGGFLRFESFKLCDNWHWYTGGDGPFTALTIMLARFYKEASDKKHFQECWDWIHKIHTKEGYFPERLSLRKDYEEWKSNEWEFSARLMNGAKKAESMRTPLKGVVYWATPLGWSHAEYIFLCGRL